MLLRLALLTKRAASRPPARGKGSNVFPSLLVNDVLQRGLADSELCCQIRKAQCSGFVQSPNFQNLLFGDNSPAVSLAERLTLFALPIGHVVLIGSKKQMVWVTAGRIIAIVKNE